MPHGFRSPRTMRLLGIFAVLFVLALSVTRLSSKAQEPAKPVDRKALREQISTLHAEIELLEIDHEIDRIPLADSIKKERAIFTKLEPLTHLSHASIDENSGEQFDREILEKFETWVGALIELAAVKTITDEELRKDLSEEPEEHREKGRKDFGKELAEEFDSLLKKVDKEEFSRARRQLAERFLHEIQQKATAEVRAKIAAQKKEFARQAAELAGKRLDLETLERQYREAR